MIAMGVDRHYPCAHAGTLFAGAARLPGPGSRGTFRPQAALCTDLRCDPLSVAGFWPSRPASRPLAYPAHPGRALRRQAFLDEAREHVACQGGQDGALGEHLIAELIATQPEHLHLPAGVAPDLSDSYLSEDRQLVQGRIRDVHLEDQVAPSGFLPTPREPPRPPLPATQVYSLN